MRLRLSFCLVFAAYVLSAQVKSITFYDAQNYKCEEAAATTEVHTFRADSSSNEGLRVRLNMQGDTLSYTHYSDLGKKRREGLTVHFHKNGKRKSAENYSKNKLHGELRSWYENGQLLRRDTYKKGKSKGGHCYAEGGTEIAHFPFRTLPEFPGGLSALSAFLSKNISYPEKARKRGIEGRVVIQFVVDTDGSIINPKVVRPVHKLLDTEALRVVDMIERFRPGTQDNVPVKVAYNLPVSFRFAN